MPTARYGPSKALPRRQCWPVRPSIKGDTFKAGDEITVVMCPLRDGRAGGASGVFVTADGTAYNPSDAGCRANQKIKDWPAWIAKGYLSYADVKKGENIQ
jgi:hypothetical protein